MVVFLLQSKDVFNNIIKEVEKTVCLFCVKQHTYTTEQTQSLVYFMYFT